MTELRSAVGRAELVRLLARGGSNEAASVAALLGFSPPVLTFELPAIGELAGAHEAPATAVQSLPVQGEKLNFKPIPFLRVGRVEYNDNEGAQPAKAVPKLDLDPPRTSRELPVPPPLVAWPRLWRVLEDVFRSLREGERLDVPRLVGEIARGQVIRRLPRQWVAGTGRVRLVLDRSRHLVPFWSDQRLLELELRWRLGPHALEVRYLGHAGPMELLAERETERLQLVVSDLGFLGTAETRETWERLGDKWRGGGARLRALVPCPPERWDQDLAKLWNATEWENPKIDTRTETPLSAGELAKKLEALQKLVAPLVRVEPGLLRELRQLLGRAADAGTEADLWALFPNPSTIAATPPPAVAEWRQKLISEGLEPDLQRRVLEVIRHWHRQLPPLILAEEIGIHGPAGVEAEEQQRYLDYLRAACAEIEARGTEPARIAAWFERWNGRMTSMPADEELVTALIGAWRRLAKEGEAPDLPDWASPALLAALEQAGELRKFGIWQRGNEIVLGDRAEGSPIGEIRSSGATIQVVGAQPRPFLLETADSRLAFELEELPPKVRIVSNLEVVELWTETRPAWAAAAGRDHYGLWADLEVGGIVQRMRYIRPGRFLMGSPTTEIGRYKDEGPQHQVTLTEGFWLADTPCTQEFWQVVMGKNPSRFQGAKRPVEQVSWDDVQPFLAKLGKGMAGGDMVPQLPTEAQWEYACRAGTQTSTYAGEEEAVRPELAWYSVNSNSETHEVAQKWANAWGLFDTLGNVWEWCADFWSGNYDGAEGVDPEGPAVGSDRVYRGGSWDDRARLVRAACRLWYKPGLRDENLGFRFSLGRPRSGQGAERRSSGSGATS